MENASFPPGNEIGHDMATTESRPNEQLGAPMAFAALPRDKNGYEVRYNPNPNAPAGSDPNIEVNMGVMGWVRPSAGLHPAGIKIADDVKREEILKSIAANVRQIVAHWADKTVELAILLCDARDQFPNTPDGGKKWKNWLLNNVDLGETRVRELMKIGRSKDKAAAARDHRNKTAKRVDNHRKSQRESALRNAVSVTSREKIGDWATYCGDIRTRGHNPVLVRGNHDVEHVADDDRVPILGFHDQGVLGDDALQLSFSGLVTGPECLVGKEGDAIAEMRIETPGHQSWRRDMDAMLAKRADDGTAQNAFAGTPPTPEYHGDFSRFTGVLVEPGEPLEDVLVVFLVPCRKDVKDVIVDRRPFALHWLDGKAPPKVQGIAVVLAGWIEDKAVAIGQTLRRFEPIARLCALMVQETEVGLRQQVPSLAFEHLVIRADPHPNL